MQFLMTDLGLLSFYLEIEVRQGSDGITLNQGSYARRILDTAGMRNYNPSPTPMEERLKLSRESMVDEVEQPCTGGSLGVYGTSSTRSLISRSQ